MNFDDVIDLCMGGVCESMQFRNEANRESAKQVVMRVLACTDATIKKLAESEETIDPDAAFRKATVKMLIMYANTLGIDKLILKKRVQQLLKTPGDDTEFPMR